MSSMPNLSRQGSAPVRYYLPGPKMEMPNALKRIFNISGKTLRRAKVRNKKTLNLKAVADAFDRYKPEDPRLVDNYI